MLQPNLIPVLDPNPLPAPYWVFKLLLIVTFFLHILAMNFLLGGAVLALVSKWHSRKQVNGNRVFFDIAKKLPVFLPATITLGIAPLLFVQVLYGQFFYTSSIIMAWPWFLVLVLLTVAYYGFYYVSFHSRKRPGGAGFVMLFSVILVCVIGFVYSNNLTLSLVPSRWGAKYFANPSGWHLNLSEPTLVPRFLHFFIAAVAVGGLLLVFVALANWKRDREYARQVLQLGGKAFMYATMAQFLVGVWFLVSLPREMIMLFTGENLVATALLLVGVFSASAAILMMSYAVRKENIRIAAYYAPALIAVVILTMCVMRDILRDAYLKPYYHPEKFIVHTQWSVFPLFLALFIGGVVLWFVMLKRYGLFRSAKPDEISVIAGSQVAK
ncbi:MAG TPA: hypothetical protein VMF56_00945 [Acidobacteriaceae bacterium]|nr:hypothetical protein [Acidobacteriaceae bacterium]